MLISLPRLFSAETRVTVAKLLWNFDLKLADSHADNWLDNQAAYIVYEPKELSVKLINRRDEDKHVPN